MSQATLLTASRRLLCVPLLLASAVAWSADGTGSPSAGSAVLGWLFAILVVLSLLRRPPSSTGASAPLLLPVRRRPKARRASRR